MTWLLNLFKSLFGIGLDKAGEAIKQDKLEAEASQARAAKAKLESNAKAEQEEAELAEALKAPTRVPPPASKTNDDLPSPRKTKTESFVDRFNRK